MAPRVSKAAAMGMTGVAAGVDWMDFNSGAAVYEAAFDIAIPAG